MGHSKSSAEAKLAIGCALAIAGCVGIVSIAAASSVPKVEDCGIVTISTPNKYICDGKVYTAYELQHLREKSEQTQKMDPRMPSNDSQSRQTSGSKNR